MVNVERLRERLEFITRNRKHHKQGIWFQEEENNACQTAGCLAGWTAMQFAKDELISFKRTVWRGSRGVQIVEYEPRDDSWHSLGRRLLDLEAQQASYLFSADNTLWDLWNLARIITNGEIQIPEEVEATREDHYNQTEHSNLSFLAD